MYTRANLVYSSDILEYDGSHNVCLVLLLCNLRVVNEDGGAETSQTAAVSRAAGASAGKASHHASTCTRRLNARISQ